MKDQHDTLKEILAVLKAREGQAPAKETTPGAAPAEVPASAGRGAAEEGARAAAGAAGASGMADMMELLEMFALLA